MNRWDDDFWRFPNEGQKRPHDWWRDLLILLGIRRITPRRGEHPGIYNLRTVEDIGDTGGGGWYRPTFRQQNPSVDPQEPYGGESSGTGNDHGWSNCTLTSGAMALDYHTKGGLEKWGGHLRHKQGDLSGGTDLYDLRDAWAAYGETLTIRSGAGWDAMKADSLDGHFIVLQGQGNVPGSESYSGGHAICVSPERNGDGKWLIGDPLASGWQWVTGTSIKDWAQAWNSSISYAISRARDPETTTEPEPEPEPEEPDCPDCPPTEAHTAKSLATMREAAYREGYAKRADETWGSWFNTSMIPPRMPVADRWSDAEWDGGVWSSPWPIPLGDYTTDFMHPAAWGEARWSGSTWR